MISVVFIGACLRFTLANITFLFQGFTPRGAQQTHCHFWLLDVPWFSFLPLLQKSAFFTFRQICLPGLPQRHRLPAHAGSLPSLPLPEFTRVMASVISRLQLPRRAKDADAYWGGLFPERIYFLAPLPPLQILSGRDSHGTLHDYYQVVAPTTADFARNRLATCATACLPHSAGRQISLHMILQEAVIDYCDYFGDARLTASKWRRH